VGCAPQICEADELAYRICDVQLVDVNLATAVVVARVSMVVVIYVACKHARAGVHMKAAEKRTQTKHASFMFWTGG
jgi:hypothetical protein